MLLCFVDTETGGTDPELNPLLEVAAIIYDTKTRGIVSQFASYVRPDRHMIIEPSALAYNGMKITGTWLAIVPSKQEVIERLMDWIEPFLHQAPIMLAGWNVNFDRGFLQQLLGRPTVERWFGYRTMDLHAIAAFLSDAGKMVYCGSQEETARMFGLLQNKMEHTALADATLSIFVYMCLKTLA